MKEYYSSKENWKQYGGYIDKAACSSWNDNLILSDVLYDASIRLQQITYEAKDYMVTEFEVYINEDKIGWKATFNKK